MHSKEVEARSLATRCEKGKHEGKEKAAEDIQRGRLRKSSLNLPSNKRKGSEYLENENNKFKKVRNLKGNAVVVPRGEKGADIKRVLQRLPRPRRYDYKGWLSRRNLALKHLKKIFPNLDFETFCNRVNELSLRNQEHGMKNLSAIELLAQLNISFPDLQLRIHYFRELLKTLSFDWLKTHSSYYDSIFDRYDIKLHRDIFCPIWIFLLTSDRVFLAIGDASHQNQNERNLYGWIDKTKPHSDEVPSGDRKSVV